MVEDVRAARYMADIADCPSERIADRQTAQAPVSQGLSREGP